MTVLLLALLGCTSDGGNDDPPGPSTLPAARRIVLTDAHAIWPSDGSYGFGEALAVGSDLDHDGVVEWAATALPGVYDAEAAKVKVFEGTDLLTERQPAQDPADLRETTENFGQFLAGGGDTDGDGFGELLITEMRVFAVPRTALVRTTNPADDIWIYDSAEGALQRQEMVFASDGERDVVLLTADGANWRIDAVAGEQLVDGKVLGPDTLVAGREDDDAGAVGEVVTLRGDEDGVDRFVLPLLGENPTLHRCDVTVGLDRSLGCEEIATTTEPRELARHQAAGDLTGDGVPELVSAGSPDGGEDGSLSVFDLSGERIAFIQGTHGAMFGAYPELLVDDDGATWLLVADRRYGDEARVYAFHQDQLQGELIDDDALRIYTTGAPGYFRLPMPYRATPDAPLQLLIADPTDGIGKVWMVNW